MTQITKDRLGVSNHWHLRLNGADWELYNAKTGECDGSFIPTYEEAEAAWIKKKSPTITKRAAP